MDQTQVKSDVPFVGNKPPTSSSSARSERQFTRVLRSKSSTAVKNTNSNNDIQKEEPQETGNIPLSKLPEAEVSNDYSNHKTDASQAAHLRQLLLLHLELIQQQQEEIQKKDKEINQLKLDKEQVGEGLGPSSWLREFQVLLSSRVIFSLLHENTRTETH